MNGFIAKVIVNVAALLFLGILLLGPVAFSQTFVSVSRDESLTVRVNDFSFGEYLQVEKRESEEKVLEFHLKFTVFPEKQSLYRRIADVKNTSGEVQTIKITSSAQEGVGLYFEEGGAYSSLDSKKLEPGQSAQITLLADRSTGNQNETREISFSLRTQ